MFNFDETEAPPIIVIPEDNSSLVKLPKEKGIFQPPQIDPAVRLKWGLALLGEEKAKEYLRWIQMKFYSDPR